MRRAKAKPRLFQPHRQCPQLSTAPPPLLPSPFFVRTLHEANLTDIFCKLWLLQTSTHPPIVTSSYSITTRHLQVPFVERQTRSCVLPRFIARVIVLLRPMRTVLHTVVERMFSSACAGLSNKLLFIFSVLRVARGNSALRHTKQGCVVVKGSFHTSGVNRV